MLRLLPEPHNPIEEHMEHEQASIDGLIKVVRLAATQYADRFYEGDPFEQVRAYAHRLQQPASVEAQPCGHPASLLLRSAETGEPLYCELCDDKSARRDAEQREQELLAEVARLRGAACPASVEGWKWVPVEPTPEMVAAWPNHNHGAGHEASIYRAMLSAAPPLFRGTEAQAEAEQVEPARTYEQMRVSLIGQIHELIDIAERHAWTNDLEERRRTLGAIAHARRVVSPYNYNGSAATRLPAMESADQAGWKREADDADELLRLLLPSLDPDDLRTDGGSINLPKVRGLVALSAPAAQTLSQSDRELMERALRQLEVCIPSGPLQAHADIVDAIRARLSESPLRTAGASGPIGDPDVLAAPGFKLVGKADFHMSAEFDICIGDELYIRAPSGDSAPAHGAKRAAMPRDIYNRLAAELPEGYTVTLRVERHAGWVELELPDPDHPTGIEHIERDDTGVDGLLSAALERAKQLAAPGAALPEAQHGGNMNSSEQCALGDEIRDRLIRTAGATASEDWVPGAILADMQNRPWHDERLQAQVNQAAFEFAPGEPAHRFGFNAGAKWMSWYVARLEYLLRTAGASGPVGDPDVVAAERPFPRKGVIRMLNALTAAELLPEESLKLLRDVVASADSAASVDALSDLAHKLHYAAYSWGFEAGKVGTHVDTTIAGNKAEAALAALLAAMKGEAK